MATIYGLIIPGSVLNMSHCCPHNLRQSSQQKAETEQHSRLTHLQSLEEHSHNMQSSRRTNTIMKTHQLPVSQSPFPTLETGMQSCCTCRRKGLNTVGGCLRVSLPPGLTNLHLTFNHLSSAVESGTQSPFNSVKDYADRTLRRECLGPSSFHASTGSPRTTFTTHLTWVWVSVFAAKTPERCASYTDLQDHNLLCCRKRTLGPKRLQDTAESKPPLSAEGPCTSPQPGCSTSNGQ